MLLTQFEKSLTLLRSDLRESKRELIELFGTRFDEQSRVIHSCDDRLRTMYTKTLEHTGLIANIQRDLAAVQEHKKSDKTGTVPSNFVAAMTAVLIAWGNTRWFPWVLAMTIATVGGNQIFVWGKMILEVLKSRVG